MAEGIAILLTILVLLGVFVVYVKWQNDKKFGIWFAEVLKQAQYFGFTQDQINDFQEIDWWDFYLQELEPEQAIKLYLSQEES